jgi:hypothetical protein
MMKVSTFENSEAELRNFREQRAQTASEQKKQGVNPASNTNFFQAAAFSSADKKPNREFEVPLTTSEQISGENRKSHIYMGKQPVVSVSTSNESFKGQQLGQAVFNPKPNYSTNVNLGTSSYKWESSYAVNYSSRGYTPNQKSRPNTNSNIVFGSWNDHKTTTAKDSFQEFKVKDKKLDEKQKNNSFCLGDFKGKFETSNKTYGANKGIPSKIDKETLENITACHFSYGNYKADCVSKFQDDFKKPGGVPDKYDLKSNENRKSHLNFGDKKPVYESMYRRAYHK